MNIKKKLFLFSIFLIFSCSIDNFLEETISMAKKNANNIQSSSTSTSTNLDIVYVDCFNFDGKTRFKTIEEALKQNVDNVFVVQNTNYILALENIKRKSINFDQTFMEKITVSNCYGIEIKSVNVLFDIQIFNSTNIIFDDILADFAFIFETEVRIKRSKLENKTNLFINSTLTVDRSSLSGIAIFSTIINSNTNFYSNELVSF